VRIAVETDAPRARPISSHLRVAVDTDAPRARPISSHLRVAVDTDAPRARPISSHLRVAVDFDGVLFDHVPYLLRGFRDAYGIDLAAEGLAFWDFFQYRAVRQQDLRWSCIRGVLDDIETDVALHLEPPRDVHARGVLAELRRAGHAVHIVTARQEKSRDVTQLFLDVHGIEHDGLVMEAARKTGYDVLIDDSPHNVLMAAADGGLALLMDHPYNRDVPTHTNPLRVRDFREAASVIARRLAAARETPNAPSASAMPAAAPLGS
jgi:uncharacterized HAD superfamily protein